MSTALSVALAGFTFGILGSLHCVGMCGPIALVLPVAHLPNIARRVALLLYNIGRAVSYAIFGVFINIVGKGFRSFVLQQRLSVFAGILVLIYFSFTYLPIRKTIPKFDFWSTSIQGKIAEFLRSPRNVGSFFVLGMLNGFLPCGLVYVAMASALAFHNLNDSILYMFMFGIGTLPAMYSMSEFGQFLSHSVRQKLSALLPYIIFFMGVLLILRGMGLGIPYISPAMKMDGSKCETSCCHKK